MSRLPRNANFWLAGFLLWFGVLWGLSSFRVPSEGVPQVQHFDKVVHFGYFFGGCGLLCAWLFRRRPVRPAWAQLIITAIIVIALIGALDEYHQSFTPGRSGNDPFDWLADLVGATAGAFTFKRIHHLLK